MNPERRKPTSDQLSNAEWQELEQRLPVLFELAESLLYTHRSDTTTTAIFSATYEDGRGNESDYYYVYRARHESSAVTMYSIDPALREISVNSDVDFSQVTDINGLMNHLQFDQITGAAHPNARNLAGLREFLGELREQDELFNHIFNEGA